LNIDGTGSVDAQARFQKWRSDGRTRAHAAVRAKRNLMARHGGPKLGGRAPVLWRGCFQLEATRA